MADFIAKIKAVLDTSQAEKQLNDLTKNNKEIKLQVSDSELDSAAKKVDNLKNKNVKVDTKVSGGKQVDNLSKSFDSANKKAGAFGNTIKGFAKFGVYLNVFNEIEKAAKATGEAIKEFDSDIKSLQDATGMNYSEVRSLMTGYNDLAREMGNTTSTVANSADAWLRQNRTLSETNQLIKDSIVLSSISKMDSEKSTEVLTATLNGFQLAADEASRVSDIISSVDLYSASDAADIGDALTKTASMANNAGVSIEKTVGIIATMKDITQDSSNSVGTAVKSVLSRMNQIRAGKFIDEETGEALNDTEKVLNKIGISMRDTNGIFKESELIIDEVGSRWSALDKNTQKAVATAMAGTHQYNKLISVFDNYNKVLDLTKVAETSAGTAATKFQDNYLNSIEAKRKTLQASFESMSFNLISRDTINNILEATTALVDFIDETHLLKGVLSGITVAGGIKGFAMLSTSIVDTVGKMNNFQTALDLLKTGNVGADEVEKLASLVTGLGNSQLKAVLSSKALTTEQRIAILTANNMSVAEAKATLSTMGLATAEGAASATTMTLSSSLRSLWNTLLANPLVLIAMGVTATVMAFNKIQDAADEAGLSFSGAQEKAQDSLEAYQNTTSELESLNSELKATSDRIAELESQDSLTLVEENELANLKEENALLQTQIEMKERLANIQAKQTAEDTRKAVNYKSEETLVEDENGNPVMDRNGNFRTQRVDRKEYVRQQLEEMQKEKQLIQEAQIQLNKTTLSEEDREIYEKQFTDATNRLEEYRSEVTTVMANLNDEAVGFRDANGNIVAGFEEDVRVLDELNTLVNNFDLSPTEQKLSQIESYFSGSTTKNLLKDRLLEVAKTSKDADAVSKALEAMGINLEEAGIDAESLNRYFSDLANSANDVADATEVINNNLTVDDIGVAFESENAGDDYVALADYIKQAKELYDQGLVGTDDFKSVAEMMSYNIDSSTEAFEKGYKKLKTYFKEDKDGNLTGQGVHNFLTDLQELNKGYATFNKETGKWDINMENTAQAAKELGIGVGVVEAILKRVKDYDNVGDFEFVTALDEFNEAKTALEGLQTILDEMEDGDRKTALEEKLKEWSPIIEEAENDLASLPDEIVTKLKFEYDLAEIQQMIDEYNKQWEMGNKSAETGAARNIAKEDYREKREEQTGYNEDSDKAYGAAYDKIATLTKELAKAKTEETRQDIQEQISAILDMQNAFQDAFSDGKATEWEQFFSTSEAEQTLRDIVVSGELTKEELENLFGVELPPQKFELEGEVNLENLSKEIAKLEEGTILTYTAEVDGEGKREIEALKNADGTVTYTADIDGVSTELEPIMNTDGSISYRIASQEEPSDKTAGVNYDKKSQEPAEDDVAGVDYTKKSQENPSDKEAGLFYRIKGVIGNIRNFITGYTELSGTAYLAGTNHATGTISDSSWIKDNWRTKKTESALVGEEGQELVATRSGYFYTVGDKGAEFTTIPEGSVVFNAQQTKELLTKGHIRGRGKAHLSGTAYLGSATGSFNFEGGATKYNSATKTTSKKKSSKSSDSDKADKTAESLDWIETLIDRIERAIESLGKTADATYINWTDRNTALSTEISKVNKEIGYQTKAYDRYMQEAQSVGLDSKYEKLVQSGKINIQTIKDENLKEKIENYTEWYEKALDCQEAIQDLNDELAELAKQKFDHIVKQFDDLLSTVDHETEMLEGMIDKLETAGYIVGKTLYEDLIENEKENISTLENELGTLKKQLEDSMKTGKIELYSEAWYELQGEIYSVKEALLDANTALVEYNNSLREVDWTLFDKTQELISLLQSEGDFLAGLLSNEKMFNKNANITDEGMATMGLHAVNYNTYMAQAEDYAKQISDIDKQLADDPYNTILLDRRTELLDQQKEMIEAAEDEKDALRDLAKEGYDTFLDHMDELIDKRKEMLNQTKSLLDYNRDISKQTANISSLEKQLAVSKRDTSEAGRVNTQRIQNELALAKDELQQTEYEKYIDDQERMLNIMRNETEGWIDMRLANTEVLLQDMLDSVNENAESIKDTLQTTADSVGYNLSTEMLGIWSPGGVFTSVVESYGEGFTTQLTTTNSILDTIRSYVVRMLGDSEEKATEEKVKVSEPVKNPASTTTNKADTTKDTTKATTTTTKKTIKVGGKINAGNAKIYDYAGDKSGERQYFRKDPIYKVLAEKDGYLKVRHHKLSSGVTGWFKKSDVKAYKTGGLVDETGLAWLDGTKRKPEMVLDAKDTENLIELKTLLKEQSILGNLTKVNESMFGDKVIPYQQMMFGDIGAYTPKFIPNVERNVSLNVDIGDIQMYGVNDPETFAINLKDALKHNVAVRNIIQSDTLGVMTGKNSLTKFKY